MGEMLTEEGREALRVLLELEQELEAQIREYEEKISDSDEEPVAPEMKGDEDHG